MPNIGLLKATPAGRIRLFLKNETVLAIASFAAVVSMFRTPPSAAYFGYIDWKVLSCLFCLMAVVSGLRRTGLIDRAAASMTRFCGSVRKMAAILVGTVFFVSMAITNDVALITFIPFSLILMKDIKRPQSRMTIITLETIAANIGSSLTPVGNPQNLYLFSFYGMNGPAFFAAIFPVVAAGGLLLFASVFILRNEKMQGASAGANYTTDRRLVFLYLALFALSVVAVFGFLDYRAVLVVVAVTIFIADRTIFRRIDYSLLFTFIGFFIFIGNLQEIESVSRFLTRMVALNPMLVASLASQAISNVPAAILLSRFTGDAGALLRGVSIGGMGTIIASLASVISYKFFAREYPADSLRYLGIFSAWNILFFLLLYSAAILMY